jgi:hypothetical protein
VPLSAGGKLKIVASADLGALGAPEGPSITYDWMLLGVAPLLWPWLILLGLLALKPNRCSTAWWILAPFACVIAFTFLFAPLLPAGTNFLLDVFAALACGLAAVWLLSAYLPQPHRLLTFCAILAALAGFSLLAAVARQGLSSITSEWIQVGIVLAFAALSTAVALVLGGRLCRGRYRPVVFGLWLLVILIVVWMTITVPFFLVAWVASGSGMAWGEFLSPVLGMAIGNFTTLLPFLILSSFNPFFRENLVALLNPKAKPAPTITPWEEALSKS